MDSLPSFTPVVYIYALCDPRDESIRYVGKSNNPFCRYQQHLVPRQLKQKCYKNSWILNLKSCGQKPVLRILQCVPECHWRSAECDWIARLMHSGCNLVNLTPGGDGGPCSEEKKAILRAANLGKKNGPPSAETRSKISQSNTGKKLDVARIERMRQSRLGIPNGRKGIPAPQSTREKISRDWWLIDPDGQVIFVRNLKQFCKDNGLQDSLLHCVATGKRKSHKGWMCQRADDKKPFNSSGSETRI